MSKQTVFVMSKPSDMIWVGVIGGWMTTLFEVVAATNLKDLAGLMGVSYEGLKRKADGDEGPFFVKKKDEELMWTVKRVRLVRIGGRGGKRVAGQSKKGKAGNQ